MKEWISEWLSQLFTQFKLLRKKAWKPGLNDETFSSNIVFTVTLKRSELRRHKNSMADKSLFPLAQASLFAEEVQACPLDRIKLDSLLQVVRHPVIRDLYTTPYLSCKFQTYLFFLFSQIRAL